MIKEKVRIESGEHSSLVVTLKREANYLILFLTGAWSLAWAGITLTILYSLATNPEKIDGELIIFTTLIILAGVFVLKYLLWHLNGIERIELNAQELTVQKLGTILTSKRKYELSQIDNFRVVTKQTSPLIFRMYGITGGQIQFGYYGNNKVFGQTLSKQEAENLVNVLNEKLLSSTRAKKNQGSF
ncbi:hypothetical protein [Pontibacter litorisediminis]|uniref:hypothetical protein n=1 Tax=Pontibacter litorisediminis TaxID=1846260 RepID=UPI0023EB094D|nr:hypothetical protein [Pontibacter litorisediminis]